MAEPLRELDLNQKAPRLELIPKIKIPKGLIKKSKTWKNSKASKSYLGETKVRLISEESADTTSGDESEITTATVEKALACLDSVQVQIRVKVTSQRLRTT